MQLLKFTGERLLLNLINLIERTNKM